MIKGIENFDVALQKAILEYIATNVDVSEDVEVEELDDYVISINGIKLYIISDAKEKGVLAQYNKDKFDSYFDNLERNQIQYIDEDLWEEDYALTNFADWLKEETDWIVDDKDYYGKYNFYEVH